MNFITTLGVAILCYLIVSFREQVVFQQWRNGKENTLPELICNTICNTVFLSSLLAKDVLSPEDIEIIENTQGGNTNRAKELYRIVQTRINAYEVLQKCLQETKQTGALELLDQINTINALNFHGSISYDRNKLIGRGCRGTKVFRGMYSSHPVAVKVIDYEDLAMEQALHEVEILKNLNGHDNIVQFYHVEVSDYSVYIALELCSSSLQDCIRNKTYPISRIEILRQATTGLEYLHNNPILHRDLKPTNILLKSAQKGSALVKLSDFGMSKQLDRASFTSISAGFETQGWMAQTIKYFDEHAAGNNEMSFASDIFPLGCIFYFTLTDGQHPFGIPARCEANILDNNAQLEIPEMKENGVDSTELICLMIAYDPSDRPPCSFILTHPFFVDEECFTNHSEKVNYAKKRLRSNINKVFLNGEKFYLTKMQKAVDPKKAVDMSELISNHNKILEKALQNFSNELPTEEQPNFQNLLEMSFNKIKKRNEMNLNSEKNVAIGIDLGTTHCCTAFYKMGEVSSIRNPHGQNTTPSYISIAGLEAIVGIDAKWTCLSKPKETTYDIKRMIGHGLIELKRQKYFWEWPFQVKASENSLKLEGSEWTHSLEEILAMLFKKLRINAETVLEGTIEKSVITVPYYFSDNQIEILKRSGETAGFKVLDVLWEPVAIAMAYDFLRNDESKEKIILIFDYGGGGIDVAVVKLKDGDIQVVGADTNAEIGGDEIDKLMAEYCAQQIKDMYGLDLIARRDGSENPAKERARIKLKEIQFNSEHAKILLTNNDNVLIEAGSFDAKGIFHTKIYFTTLFQNRYTNVPISREKFNGLIDKYLSKALELIEKVLDKCNLRKRDINKVVLAGGCSNIPIVKEIMGSYFAGVTIIQDINYEEMVAYGAALHAAFLNRSE